jgi:predicted Zn-dependent peptidase
MGKRSSGVGLLFVCFALAVSAAAPAQTALPNPSSSISDVHETRLPNGLVVAVQEDHRAPIVSLELRYDAGERSQPDQPCVAGVTVAAMHRRTRHVPAGQHKAFMERAGGNWHWSVGWDATVIKATLPASALALPLWLWSDGMGFFDALDETTLSLSRAEIREQMHGTDGTQAGRVDAFAWEALFPKGHPYRTVTCEAGDVDQVTGAQVKAFHDRWVAPDHAWLSIVGDVQTEAALALVRRYFATLPASATPPPEQVPLARLDDATEVDVAAPVASARVDVYWLTPRLYNDEDARLDVASELLTGYSTGWLRWSLVDQAKVATRVSSRQHSFLLGSYFQVHIEGAPQKTPAEILAAFDATMVTVRQRKPSQASIEQAVYEKLVDRLVGLEEPYARAHEFVTFEAGQGMATYLNHDLDRFRMGPQEVTDAIAQWLPPDRRVVVFVTPNPSAPFGGERLGTRSIPTTGTSP